jgi:hypothetical protein
MAIMMGVERTSFREGELTFGAWDLSATETTGIDVGYPVAIESSTGNLIKADQANGLKMVGVIYEGSAVSPFGAYDHNPRNARQAFGTKESGSLTLFSKYYISICDTVGEPVNYFRVKDVALTGTVATNTDTTIVGTSTAFTTELKVGDYVTIGGEKRQIDTITDATHATVSVAFGATATGLTATANSMMQQPIFLGDTSGTTKYSKLDIPYSTLVPVTGSGEWQQVCGKILGKNIIEINTNIDVTGKTY